MTRIFIGNLDFRTREHDLLNAFAAYGRVEKVTIARDSDEGRSRGYGFVEMPDRQEAQAAARALSGAQLHGQPLHIKIVIP